jgi:hypothetical protein
VKSAPRWTIACRAWADSQAALRQHVANVPRLGAHGASTKVLFVCTGNICRSPLAATLEAQYPTMKVASAGFVSRESAPPDNVLAVAAARASASSTIARAPRRGDASRK